MRNQAAPRPVKKSSRVASRRKRGEERLNRPLWIYLDPEEHDAIEQAAAIERRSKSSFVADAALDRAMNILRIYNQGVSEKQRKRG